MEYENLPLGIPHAYFSLPDYLVDGATSKAFHHHKTQQPGLV